MLWDYIVVGGGLSGSVVSSRLHESNQSLSILVIEAGPNANNDPSVVWTNSTNGIGGQYDWNLTSVEQQNLNSRNISLPQGKALGGGTVINGADWTRGDRFEYSLWGEIVGDDRWSYEGLLPYMKKTEAWPGASLDSAEHGFQGNIDIQTVISTHREYPLRQTLLTSYTQIGIEASQFLDADAGNAQGIGDYTENRRNGTREIASNAYSLDGVTILTETMVQKVIFSKHGNVTQAAGIELANGTQIFGDEVILSAGAIRTPQILKLSGIGPADELTTHNITVLLDSPEVGKNFADHNLGIAVWKLRNASAGYTVESGNPLFEEIQYSWGSPVDFTATTTVPAKGLAAAIEADEGVVPNASHPLLQNRTWFEHVVLYEGADDGSEIEISGISLLVTARGSVKLASASVVDDPLVDPNYLGTEVDRYVFREGLRQQIALLGSNRTKMSTEVTAYEVPPTGFDVGMSINSTDEYLDARARAGIGSTYHPMGSAAMGKVVDTNLKVKGIERLHVIDASVLPVVITGHLQVAVYAMAEQGASILINEAQRGTNTSGTDEPKRSIEY